MIRRAGDRGVRGARATTPTTLSEPLAAADRNLADCFRHLMAHADRGEYVERDGIAMFAGAHNYPGPYCNGLMRLDSAISAEQTLARGREFFRGRRRGYAVWIRPAGDEELDAAARAAGYQQRPPVEGNALTMIDHTTGPPRRPEILEPIATQAQAEEYLEVIADAYGMAGAPRSLLEAVFFAPAAVLPDNVGSVIARVDGQAVAGATAIMSGDVIGILWVATRPALRGNGYGPECMRHIVDWGFERGARLAFAQSSQMGTPRWLKLGFEVAGYYRRHIAPPVPPA
jgi:GNAT superfamily N-acetyltransferase